MAPSRNSGREDHLDVIGMWRELMKDLFSSYRPERDYMRGPGPKWQAKQQDRA